MKSISLYTISILIFFSSCVVSNKADMFTSVGNVLDLKLNSSFDQAVTTLDTRPHNIFSSQIDGYTAYEFRYKLIEREVNPLTVDSKEYRVGNNNENTGKVFYKPEAQRLFLFFKDYKLVAFITNEGISNFSSKVLLNKTLYQFMNKSDKCFLIKEGKLN